MKETYELLCHVFYWKNISIGDESREIKVSMMEYIQGIGQQSQQRQNTEV